jgi:glycosyltransferase involved in cell wall biosynthesis
MTCNPCDGDVSPEGIAPEAHAAGARARISICIPAYNLARYLPTAIVSGQQQTSSPWEIVVSNNHSTDDTESVLQAFSTDIRVVKPSAHVGYGANCRYVVSQATGTHVVLLAADDALAPTFIREVRPHLASVGMVTTGRFDCTDEMQVAGYRGGNYIGKKPLAAPAGFRHYLRACTYSISGTVFRRDSLLNLPPLPEDAANVYDWYLGLMIGRTETIHRLWKPLHYYRYHESNTSHSQPAKWLANAAAMFDYLLREVPWSDSERLQVEERARFFAREALDQPLASLEQPWKDVLTSFCERRLAPEDARAGTGNSRRARDARGSTARGLVKGLVREVISKGICRAVHHPSYLTR